MMLVIIANKVASIIYPAVICANKDIANTNALNESPYYFWSDLSVRNRVASLLTFTRVCCISRNWKRMGGGGNFTTVRSWPMPDLNPNVWDMRMKVWPGINFLRLIISDNVSEECRSKCVIVWWKFTINIGKLIIFNDGSLITVFFNWL